jgi:hypothetical protein
MLGKNSKFDRTSPCRRLPDGSDVCISARAANSNQLGIILEYAAIIITLE